MCKPCPFCDSPDARVFCVDAETPIHWVECTKCIATGPKSATPEAAVAAWDAGDKSDGLERRLCFAFLEKLTAYRNGEAEAEDLPQYLCDIVSDFFGGS